MTLLRSGCCCDGARRPDDDCASSDSRQSHPLLSHHMAAPTDSPADNSLGIPAASFLEDVEQYMKEQGPDAEAGTVIKRLDEQHSKYRFMELNLTGKKRRLKKQVPDMRASLDVLSLLRARRAAGRNKSDQ